MNDTSQTAVSPRRGRVAIALAAAALALTACAGLPTSGPVNPGVAADDIADEQFLYYPGGPAAGATPEQIVSGFVEAATSPAGAWATAREFLTPSFAEEWEPDDFVMIDVPSVRAYDDARLEDEGVVELSVQPIATVDERGVYRAAETDTADIAYEVEQQDDGEWRISLAPPGIVLDRDLFPNVYSDYTLHFYDATWTYLVPDVRWFPEGTGASRLASELLLGASPYDADAVETAFPSGTRLAPGGTAVDDSGVAEITLTAEAAGVDDQVTGRMRTQLTATLASVGVQGVRLRADDAELSGEEHQPLSTRVDSRPLVLGDTGNDEGFGFIGAGGVIDSISGLSDAMEAVEETITSVVVSADRTTAVYQDDSGTVWRRTADGGDVLDQRENLIEPSLDPQGFPWSVPADRPGELASYAADYAPIEIENAFSGADRVDAMSVSRDGSRMAALVSTSAGHWATVLPIIREPEGTPVALGDPVAVTALDGAGVDVAWVNDTTIGIVANDAAGLEIIEQQIGGPATRMSSESDIVSISAGSAQSPIRLRDSGGTLFVRRGSTWQPSATGIEVLATQLGAPVAG